MDAYCLENYKDGLLIEGGQPPRQSQDWANAIAIN